MQEGASDYGVRVRLPPPPRRHDAHCPASTCGQSSPRRTAMMHRRDAGHTKARHRACAAKWSLSKLVKEAEMTMLAAMLSSARMTRMTMSMSWVWPKSWRANRRTFRLQFSPWSMLWRRLARATRPRIAAALPSEYRQPAPRQTWAANTEESGSDPLMTMTRYLHQFAYRLWRQQRRQKRASC